jgi:uncharacterized protein
LFDLLALSYLLTMDSIKLLKNHIDPDTKLYHIIYTHSRSVADKALSLAMKHPELPIDHTFLEEAALIHDIGIFKTNAPDIECFGSYPYICHGFLGREIIEKEGYPLHALVCERHTGTGLSLSVILDENLPLPHRDMIPVSLEEKLICFADKFFSKSRLNEEFELPFVRSKLEKYGLDVVNRFDEWCKLFM